MATDAARIERQLVDKISGPIEQATGLPNNAYTDHDFFELERDELFARQWTALTQACVIPKTGDALPLDWMGIPLLAVRTRDNSVRVFHNVCSHRGNQLVWEPCSGRKMLTCPYHAWSYNLDGHLMATPHIGGHGQHDVDGFDKKQHGLREVRSHVWMDVIFVNLADNQPDFKSYIAPLESRMGTLSETKEFGKLKPATDHGDLVLTVNANWKLCIENNLESYHLPWVHPDLNSISRLEDHYHFYGDELFAGQGSIAYAPDRGNLAEFPRLQPWTEQKAEYPTLFPNLFLGFQSDHFWTMVIQPKAVDATHERLQLYYLEDAANDTEHEASRASQLAIWTKVFNEDVGVVEGMQRGRKSPAFGGGVFSPKMDDPTHHFAKWIATRLSA